MSNEKGLGSYIKSRRHYINTIVSLLRDFNLFASDDTLLNISELYEVSKAIEFECGGDNIKVPALWLSYRMRFVETREELIALAKIVIPLLEASYKYQESGDKEEFLDFNDFEWEEWGSDD